MAEPSPSEYELATPPPGASSPRRPPSPLDDDETPPLPKPPAGPPSPPKPLPRLSRSAPLSAAEAERRDQDARPQRRPRRERDAARAEAAAPADHDGENRSLVAPTPALDTVEGRGRVRLALGIVAILAVGLAVAMVIRAVGGGGKSDDSGYYVVDSSQMFAPPPDNALRPSRVADPGASEGPSRDLLLRARSAMTIPLARAQLQRIVDSYPDAPAAAEAREALDRIARGLPPFPDVPTLAPDGPVRAPAPAPDPPAIAAAEPDAVAPRPSPTPAPAPPPEPVLRVLPDGYAPHPDVEEHPSGWPTRIVSDRDGMTLILVPGGSYIIGRDGGTPSEGPAHRVELPPYYLDEHEVTVEQFARYRDAMTRRGETAQPGPEDLTRLGLSPRHPVVLVSAREALRYADWAGRSLPTEAQWEAAARGPEALIRPWGAGPSPWTDRRGPRQLDPVRSHPADRSPAGAFDLAANAWEWASDWFDASAYNARAGRVLRNPAGPAGPIANPPRQTVRGSSPAHDSTHREGMRLDTRLPYLGFRCALNVEGLPVQGLPPRPAGPRPAGPRPASPPTDRPAPQPRPPADGGTLVPF